MGEYWVTILGFVALATSVVLILTGFPHQVYTNHKRRSVEGISFPLMFGAFVAYFVWLLYGLAQWDYFLIVSQLFGCIACGIVLFQFYLYRDKTPRS